MGRPGIRYVIVAGLVLCLFGIVQLSQRFTGDESAGPTPSPTATARLSAQEQARAEAEQQQRLAERLEVSLGPTRPEDVVPTGPVEPGSLRLVIVIRDELPLDIYAPTTRGSVERCVIPARRGAGWVEAATSGGEETVSTSLPSLAARSADGACTAQLVMDVPARPSYDVRAGLEGPDGEDRAVLIAPRTIDVSGDIATVMLVG